MYGSSGGRRSGVRGCIGTSRGVFQARGAATAVVSTAPTSATVAATNCARGSHGKMRGRSPARRGRAAAPGGRCETAVERRGPHPGPRSRNPGAGGTGRRRSCLMAGGKLQAEC